MKLVGAFTVSAFPEQTWGLLMDPHVLCSLASSCEEARQIDATHYEGTIKAKVSLLTVRATVLGEVLEAHAPRYLRVALQGKTTGMPDSFTGMAELRLLPVQEGTRGEYVLQVDALDNLGNLGEPFLQKTAQRMADTFADKLSGHLDTNRFR